MKKSVIINFTLIILLFALFFTYWDNRVTDPFLFRNIAAAEYYKDSTHVPLNNPRLFDETLFAVPFAEIMIIILANISNIPLNVIQYLPILGVLSVFALYSFSREIGMDEHWPFLATLLSIYAFNRSSANGISVWPHAWGFFSYILVVLLIIKLLRKISIKYVALIVIIVSAINYYSYTSTMWCILLITFTALTLALKGETHKSKSFWELLVILIVIYVGFNRMIYGHYIALVSRFIKLYLSQGMTVFITKFLKSTTSGLLYSAPTLVRTLGTLQFSIFSIVVFTYFFKVILKRLDNMNKEEMTITALVLVGIVDIVVYLTRGVITLRYILYIFPLIFIYITYRSTYDSAQLIKLGAKVLLIVTIVVTIISPYINIINNYQTMLDHDVYKITYPYYWLRAYNSNRLTIIGDQRNLDYWFYLETTYVKQKNPSVLPQQTLIRVYIDEKIYKFLIKGNASSNINGYFIIDFNLSHIDTIPWIQFKPYKTYRKSILSNNHLQMLYSNGDVVIGVPCHN